MPAAAQAECNYSGKDHGDHSSDGGVVMRTTIGKHRHADIAQCMEEDGREQAPGGAVVEPDDQESRSYGFQAFPGDPFQAVVRLQQWDEMPDRRHHADEQAGRQRPPSGSAMDRAHNRSSPPPRRWRSEKKINSSNGRAVGEIAGSSGSGRPSRRITT